MKRLIIILLLCPLFVSSQIVNLSQDKYIQPDKAKHIIGSVILTNMALEVGYSIEMKKPEVFAIFAVMTIGFAKECLYDGYPSGKDVAANFAGIVVGYGVNKLVHRVIKRHGIHKPT